MSQSTLLDRVIAYVSPAAAAKRLYYRDAMNSYRGGVPSRLGRPWPSNPTVAGGSSSERARIASMRDRARMLDQDNVLAASLLDRATENVIGAGISMKAQTKNPAFNAAADQAWADWCQRCDITGRFSFPAMQQLLYRQMCRDGDMGTILVDRGGLPQLQLIEADRLATPIGSLFKPSVKDGVELNPVGRPVRYWVKAGEEYGKFAAINADNFIHLARIKATNQYRGVPAFAQSFALFDHIEAYVEASVIAARAAANQALLIIKNNPGLVAGQLPTGMNGSGESQRIQRQEPGMVHYLAPGEDVRQANPAHPTQQFPDFVTALSRFVGLPFGLTIEQILLDFSRANYSSSRAARLQTEATALVEQQRFYEVFLRRVWRWWISKTVNNGELPNPPADYWAHEWIPQGKPWVDPTKEIQAALMAIDAGLDARSLIVRERGYDWKRMVETNKSDRADMMKAELPMVNSTMTRHPQLGVGAQGDPLGVETQEPKPAVVPADGSTPDNEDDQ
jgi:lambda family phage portal protein